MASPSSSSFTKSILTLACAFLLVIESSSAQLSFEHYAESCPQLFPTVRSTVQAAIAREARMGASLLRLFFHDCFVNVIFYSSLFQLTEYMPIYLLPFAGQSKFIHFLSNLTKFHRNFITKISELCWTQGIFMLALITIVFCYISCFEHLVLRSLLHACIRMQII